MSYDVAVFVCFIGHDCCGLSDCAFVFGYCLLSVEVHKCIAIYVSLEDVVVEFLLVVVCGVVLLGSGHGRRRGLSGSSYLVEDHLFRGALFG